MPSQLFFPAQSWFHSNNWEPFAFQERTWKAALNGENGLVNAPTGSGKTYSLLVPILTDESIQKNPHKLGAVWITPIRALAREIKQAAEKAIEGLSSPCTIEIRTSDTSQNKKKKLLSQPPTILITTPESLHLMFTYKHYPEYFENLRYFVADEWHELMGSKRGTQVELGLSRLKTIAPEMRIWGISATIGNMNESIHTLLGNNRQGTIIRSDIKKTIKIKSILPDQIDSLPWTGHLGLHLIQKLIPLLKNSKTTLVFTNTRGQCEIWYQKILEVAPEFAGQIAMHHSAISTELRNWVENALHEEKLKIVVCTSSLDLGVDFRPVETIVQIGSPKGVARFLQRAGRSGHRPGETSKIFFLPTHSLELLEASALREGVKRGTMEQRIPYRNSYDVLAQYLITLSCSGGFYPEHILKEIKSTHAFEGISMEDWHQTLDFITLGGASLDGYDEYRKVYFEGKLLKIMDQRTALRHRMGMGTIVGESSVLIKLKNGKAVGTVEEWFVSRINIGGVFWFAGRNFELLSFQGLEAIVRPSAKKAGPIPSWQGGRMPLSSELAHIIREKIELFNSGQPDDQETNFLHPLMVLQSELSHLPSHNEFLIEYIKSNEGYHVFMYPFEGRFVHEGIGALVAHKISEIKPITLSIAMNDYGFELLSDQEIPIYEALENDLFNFENLRKSIDDSVNSMEMARRKFRDIAAISGLIFKGMPGRKQKERHLQTSVRLLFDVFTDYEPNHILLNQSYQEVFDFQLEEKRMSDTISRINKQKIVFRTPERPTPFCFPIMVDGMRERVTTEKLEDRIKKMEVWIDD